MVNFCAFTLGRGDDAKEKTFINLVIIHVLVVVVEHFGRNEELKMLLLARTI